MRKDSRADEDEDWTLHQPDLSLPIWKAMEATSWRHLPFPGGLLDQPDWLIHDLYVLAWRRHVLDEQLKTPAMPVTEKRVFFGGEKNAAKSNADTDS